VGGRKATVRLDQSHRRRRAGRLVTSPGGKVTRGALSIALMKAVKNE